MKNKTLALVATAALAALASGAAWADRLQDIKQAGVLRVAAFDANPPFGFVDPKTRKIVGLDVDYAQEFVKRLGVKLQLVPTNPANRVPLLLAGKVDLVLANFTITEERAKQVGFSIPYFASGTQFIAPKGALTTPQQLSALRIGVDKGTTNEIVLREMEIPLFVEVLNHCEGNQSRAAALLGIHRATLRKKLKDYGLS